MSDWQDMAHSLKAHVELCERLVRLLESECRALHGDDADPTEEGRRARERLLPELERSVSALRHYRLLWQQLPPEERSRHEEIGRLARLSQELTMKVILLDRDNEQTLLRRGLVPTSQLPAANRQRPHFVAEMYRRNVG